LSNEQSLGRAATATPTEAAAATAAARGPCKNILAAFAPVTTAH